MGRHGRNTTHPASALQDRTRKVTTSNAPGPCQDGTHSKLRGGRPVGAGRGRVGPGRRRPGGSLHVLRETVLGRGLSAGQLPGSNPAEGVHLSYQSLCQRHGGWLGPRPARGLARAGLWGDLSANWEMPRDHLEQDPNPHPFLGLEPLEVRTPGQGGRGTKPRAVRSPHLQEFSTSTFSRPQGTPPWRNHEHSPKSLVQTARSTSVSLQGRQGAAGRQPGRQAGLCRGASGRPLPLGGRRSRERQATGQHALDVRCDSALGPAPHCPCSTGSWRLAPAQPELRSHVPYTGRPQAPSQRLPHPHPKVQGHPLAHRLLPRPLLSPLWRGLRLQLGRPVRPHASGFGDLRHTAAYCRLGPRETPGAVGAPPQTAGPWTADVPKHLWRPLQPAQLTEAQGMPNLGPASQPPTQGLWGAETGALWAIRVD